MLLFILGACFQSTPETTVQQKVDILEQVEQDPFQAKELCGQLEASQRGFCTQFALQALPKDDVVHLRELCPTLEGNSKGECWFQVAERSVDITDCEQATPFVKECYSHVVLRQLLKEEPQSWDEVESILQQNRLDPSYPKFGVVAYQYWFRATSSLQLSDCKEMPHSKICHDAMSMLYLQRLKEWDLDPKAACDRIPEKLAHSEQIVLKVPFEKVFERKCVSMETP